jgi:hypothetical protein
MNNIDFFFDYMIIFKKYELIESIDLTAAARAAAVNLSFQSSQLIKDKARVKQFVEY